MNEIRFCRYGNRLALPAFRRSEWEGSKDERQKEWKTGRSPSPNEHRAKTETGTGI